MGKKKTERAVRAAKLAEQRMRTVGDELAEQAKTAAVIPLVPGYDLLRHRAGGKR